MSSALSKVFPLPGISLGRKRKVNQSGSASSSSLIGSSSTESLAKKKKSRRGDTDLMDDDASCDAVTMIPDTPPAAPVSTSESLLRELLAGQQSMKGTLDDVSLKIAAITLDLTNVKQKVESLEKGTKQNELKIRQCMEDVGSVKVHTETDIKRIRQELVVLSEKIGSLSDAAAVTKAKINDVTSNANDQSATGTTHFVKRAEVQALLQEQHDVMSRSNSIILFGLPESVSAVPTTCRNVMSEAGVSLPEVTTIERIGKKATTTDSETRPRPVRIRTSMSIKDAVFRHRFKLTFLDRPLYVGHDLTPHQQAARKAVVPLFRTLRKKGVTCSLPYDKIVQGGVPLPDERIAQLLQDGNA
eukprot:scpid89154/ scgid13500/ 